MARKGKPKIFLMVLKEIKGETNKPVFPWVQRLQKEYGDVFQGPLPGVVLPSRRNRVQEIPTEGTLHHLDLYTVYLQFWDGGGL
jgi:hypothetical protein